MAITENELKAQLAQGVLRPVYVFHGEEPMMIRHYVRQVREKAVGESDLGEFNLIELDGRECGIDAIVDAAEALPLMAERKCVCVREADAAAPAMHDRLMALLRDPPESCVLILWYLHTLDPKRGARMKAFLAAAETAGDVVELARRTPAELARLLCRGASRRGCTLSADTARQMVEQCGEDMQQLLSELDKLCALAGEGGEITPALLETAAVRALSARVYDLSKAILRGDYAGSFTLLSRLFAAREEPVSVLAVLSGAYADLYRAKVAAAAGVPAASLAAALRYRGREFALRNAERDCRRLELSALRRSLELLADADRRLKGSRVPPRIVLEQTVAQLIVIGKGGTL